MGFLQRVLGRGRGRGGDCAGSGELSARWWMALEEESVPVIKN